MSMSMFNTQSGVMEVKPLTGLCYHHRTEPVLKIQAVGLTVVNGKWSCDYTNQGIAARQRALDRGYRGSGGSRPPQPRDQSLHRSKDQTKMFSVRSTQYAALTAPPANPSYVTLVTTLTVIPSLARTLPVCQSGSGFGNNKQKGYRSTRKKEISHEKV